MSAEARVTLEPARPTEAALDAGEDLLAQRTKTATRLSAFASGVLFAVGLALSGMTLPEKVLAFLSFGYRWAPALAFVMGGAIGVHAVLYRVIRRRGAPLFASRFFVTLRRALDARLVLGAAIFGVGWGLGGYCPAPALVSLAAGSSSSATVWVFVAAMAVGILLGARFDRRSTSVSG